MRVLAAERAGQPAVILSHVPAGTPEPVITIDGYPIYTRHQQIDFGDGGTAKSLYALWRAGKLEAEGERVALFDWELDVLTHRQRLEQLFGRDHMPSIRYVRVDRPLVHEVDRLRRIIVDEEITYGIFDSRRLCLRRATRGRRKRPELLSGRPATPDRRAAPRARQQGGQRRPTAVRHRAFWHNSARSTWFVKAATNEPGRLTIGLLNRKANLGPRQPALALHLHVHAGDHHGHEGRRGQRRRPRGRSADLAAHEGGPERRPADPRRVSPRNSGRRSTRSTRP